MSVEKVEDEGFRSLGEPLCWVGETAEARELRALLERVAASPVANVLVTGESGVGKDLAAHLIHQMSSRDRGQWVNIACGALPDALLEVEIFGQEAGVVTGTEKPRPGLFELADGGTLYLDEISQMTPSLQGKLLRFLDERTFRRVGGTRDIRVDVRVVATTQCDPDQLVSSSKLRGDLYYRLRGIPIRVPPLRERRGDIGPLAHHFVRGFNASFGKSVRSIAPAALDELVAHDWPGNVRELRHTMERAMLLADGDVLTRVDCRSTSRSGEHLFRLPANGLVLSQIERSLVVQALEATRWNQVRAARLLGLNRDQVRYRIEKFGLSAPERAGDDHAA